MTMTGSRSNGVTRGPRGFRDTVVNSSQFMVNDTAKVMLHESDR